MTYEEFEKLVEEQVSQFDSYASSYEKTDGFYISDGKIIQKHETGGASGGNCWGDDAEYFSSDYSTQDFLPLEKILTLVKPDIAYLKVKEIERLITEDSETDYEYYGNHTRYDLYKLDIRQLYDKLFA